MNKVILLVLLMPVTAFGQIMENFESGNLSGWIQNPEGRWNTDNSIPLSGNFSLHHFFDNPDAGSDCIGLAVRNLRPGNGTAKWNFSVRHGYDPSASNNWAVFLMSDSDPSSVMGNPRLNGFAVGVNQAGYDDTLRLYKVKGGIFSTVINTGINWQSGIGMTDPVKISAERSTEGDWKLDVFHMNGSPVGSATGKDPELFRNEWFLILYRYSSARDRLLWLDDIGIDGIFRDDNEPPEITECKVAGDRSLLLSFNEEVSEGSLIPSNFSVFPSGGKAVKIIRETQTSVKLEFEEPFMNKSISKLVASNLCDRLLNCKSICEFEFTPVRADPGDIIISEIMADPSPAVSLPAKEYIEIYNRSHYSFNLSSWSLSDGNSSSVFSGNTILSGDYMILCRVQDTALFRIFGRTAGLNSFPALTDGGKIIYLTDNSGTLIHGVEYSSRWYGDILKAGGGWSLEMIDTDYPFSPENNWHASLSKTGGSPGKINSVAGTNPDREFSGIENVFPADSFTISINFSESVFDLGKNIKSISTGGPGINSLIASDPLSREYTILLRDPLQKGRIYTIVIGDEVTDFAGNRMRKNEFSFGIPEPVRKRDILFNELLFNPFPGEPDFIEFYNCSDRILDPSDLFLVSVNDELNDTSSITSASAENRCIIGRNYFVITSDKEALLSRFPVSDPEKIFEVSSLPSMPDDDGHLILFNRGLDKIDEVFYDDDMHYSLLGADEGISLEKIRTNGMSADKSQWHSASETSGWGTPGLPNSVLSERQENADMVILSSTRITPDNDGNDDLLVIDLKLSGNGNVVSVAVFDETGSFIKKIADNMLAGPEASIVWNGTQDDEKLVSTGIYVILIEVFDDTGKVRNWKKVCTVIR